MSSLAIKPVKLKESPQGFRPHRLGTWAPPGQELFFNMKKMGQKKSLGDFSVEQLPKSLAVALGSAGALFIGSKMPAPWNTILVGASLVGLGYSIYNLFGAPSSQAIEERAGIASENAFERITGGFLYPTPSSNITTSLFDLKYIFNNNSNEDVKFPYDIFEETRSVGIPELLHSGIAYSSEVAMAAGKSSGTITTKVKMKSPEGMFWYEPGFSETLTLRKYDSQGKPHPVASVKFYVSL